MSIRPQGRPKNRCEDDVRNEMKKWKIKNWMLISANLTLRRLKYTKTEVLDPKEE